MQAKIFVGFRRHLVVATFGLQQQKRIAVGAILQ